MTAPQRTRLRSRRRVAGLLIAACCVCFSASLQAAVVVETFTDYNAFLSLLGSQAQVVNFDDVPTTNGYGYFDHNRYAAQGIVFLTNSTVFSQSDAVSPPNVYADTRLGGSAAFPTEPPGLFTEMSYLSFTHGGQSALTSAFGTFFIGNRLVDVPGPPPTEVVDLSGMLIGINDVGFTPAPTTTSPTGSTFLGLATVDSVTGQLVPAISAITVRAGTVDALFDLPVYLDNFTFATPVPEGNAWALLAVTALSAAVLYRRRAAVAAQRPIS